MEINIRALSDFLQCPLIYKFKYIDKLVPHRQYLIYEAFEQAMHQLFYYLFYQVQNSYYPSSYHLKQAWGRIWCPNRSREQIIGHLYSNAQKISYSPRAKERQGLELGLAMKDYYKNKSGTPILIGKAYTVPIGRHTVFGIIELVREIDQQLEIIDARTSMRRIPVAHLKHDIEITAASFATRYLLRTKEARVIGYYIEGNKQIITTRGQEDYEVLNKILSRVEKAIKQGLWWPSMSESCSICSFRPQCAKGNWY